MMSVVQNKTTKSNDCGSSYSNLTSFQTGLHLSKTRILVQTRVYNSIRSISHARISLEKGYLKAKKPDASDSFGREGLYIERNVTYLKTSVGII